MLVTITKMASEAVVGAFARDVRVSAMLFEPPTAGLAFENACVTNFLLLSSSKTAEILCSRFRR
jgi:hypothetical protein